MGGGGRLGSLLSSLHGYPMGRDGGRMDELGLLG